MRRNAKSSNLWTTEFVLCILLAGFGATPSHADSIVGLGADVRDMVATPSGEGLYFNLETDELVAVNMGATSVSARVTVAGGPGVLALSPDGSRLYVSLVDNLEIAVYSAPGLSFIRTLHTSSTYPTNGLVVGPNRLYATHQDGFSILDLATGDELYFRYSSEGAMRMKLLSDNNTLVGVTTTGAPNHLYQFDVSSDTLEMIGAGCCHSCTGGFLGQYEISLDESRVYLAAATPYHAQVLNLPETGLTFRTHNILTGSYPECLAVSPAEDTVYVGHGAAAFVVVSTQDWLPHSIVPLQHPTYYKNCMVLSSGGDMLAVVTNPGGTQAYVEFVTLGGHTVNRGGVKLRPVDSVDGLPIPNINGWLVLGQGDASFIDTENGVFANAPLEEGSYSDDLGAPGYESVNLNFDIVAGQWTDLGDVPMTLTGDRRGPFAMCATPAAVTNQITTLTLHGQYFEPNVVLDTLIPEFSIVDYTWLSPFKIEVTVSVGHYDDPVREYNAIRVTNPSSIDQNFATVFVIPGGVASLEFAEPTSVVTEGAGTIDLQVTRTGAVGGQVTIDYEIIDGTATAGDDYTAVSDTLTWPDGDSDPKTITVPILQDAIPEGPETFTVELSNPTGGAVLGAIDTTEVTIDDDDSSTVRFTVAATGVAETGGTISLTVSRTGDITAAGSVTWATADGLAVAGQDYTSAGGTLDWAAGNGDEKTIMVTILDDALYEETEAFTVVLSSPGGNAFLGDPSTATVSIADDDVIEIVFSTADFAADEGDGNATITAWRTGATNGTVTADFATTGGTATPGGDYTNVSGTLSWADGDSAPKTFDVPLIEDGNGEIDETVLLSLSSPTGGATIGAPGTATLTIEDNDGTSLQFTAASFNVGETAGEAIIIVQRVGGDSSGTAAIDYATADGTAVAGLDYHATSGTLSWADGNTDDKTFSVIIFDDGVLEGFESLTVELTNPTGNATLGTPTSAVIAIADDEWVGQLVNTETGGSQTRPDAAMNATGDSVVVWESYLQDGGGWGIFGQRYDADGDPVGSEFQVNAAGAGDQRYPAAAMRPDGSFTVVWLDSDADGDGIRGRRFNAAGAPVGGDFAVNSTTAGDQTAADVAVDGSGVGIVVWQSDATGDLEIRGRRLDASGVPIGAELTINSTTADDQQAPAIAGAAGGGFAVVWQGYGQDGPADGTIGRLFAANGSPTGTEFIVNEWTAGNQISPAVCRAADGSSLFAWEDTTNKDGFGSSIRARWFSAAGTPLGGDVQANTYWLDDQMNPTVACAGPGNAVITWESEDQDGSDLGIYTQALGHDGVLSGIERRMNTYVFGVQYRQAVADSASGSFWAIWASGAQDGSGDGIYGLFSAAPVIAEIFTDGFESGDTSAWAATTP